MRIAAIILIAAVVVFSALSFFVSTQGKIILTTELTKVFKKPVDIRRVQLIFPLGLSIQDLSVQDFGHIKRVEIGLGLVYLFAKHMDFSRVALYEPAIVLNRKDFGAMPSSVAAEEENKTVVSAAMDKEKPSLPEKIQNKNPKSSLSYVIHQLTVKGGSVQFRDEAPAGNFVLAIDSLSLTGRDFSYPHTNHKSWISVSAVLRNKEGKSAGEIKGEGWFNFFKKDMKGQCALNNVDARLFIPFYQDSAARAVKSGAVDANISAESKNNDMDVHVEVKLKNLAFEKNKKDSVSWEDVVVTGLQSVGQGVALNFNFKTKMDSFEVSSIPFSGNLLGGTKSVPQEPLAK